MRVGSAAHVRVEGFTCVSRGLRTHSGVNVRTHNVAVGSLPPWPGTRQCAPRCARNHSGQAPDNVREQPIPPGTAQNADHFATSSPFSAFLTEVVCVLGATLPRTAAAPPPIWGNCAMQGCDTPATRRQKALHGAKPPPPPVASALQGGREGLAAAPVGGGGAWPGFEAGPSCGVRGRRRGQAAVLVGGGRARAGLEIDHSERSSRVAISRAGRRRPAHTAARPIKAGQATVENQPGPPAPGTPVGPQATRPSRKS